MHTDKLKTNVLSLGIIQIANYVLPLISVPIMARMLGPEKMGLLNFMQSFIAYFTLLVNFGFNVTGVRRMTASAYKEEERSLVFSEIFFTQLLLFAIALLLFLVCLIFIPELLIEWKVSLFTFAICVATLLTQDWLFQAMHELPKIAVLNFISKLSFTLLTLLLIRKQSDYILYACLYSTMQILIATISFIWSIKRYRLRLLRVPFRTCWSLILEEKTFFFSVIVINLYTSTNVVLLGLLTNHQNVGYFTAGQKLSSIILMVFIAPIKQVFFPHVSRALKESQEGGFTIAKKLVAVIFWPALLLGLFTLVFSKQIIFLIYGHRFEPAVLVLQILAFLPLIVGLSSIWGVLIMMNLKQDGMYFRVTIVSAITGILLNFILTPSYMHIGSAVALLVSEAIGTVFIFFYLSMRGIKLIDATYFNPVKFNQLILQQFKS